MVEIYEREALVVCCENNMNAGITIWDMKNGQLIFRIPICASPPHGLLCLRNQFLVASQVQKHRSFGGGAIFIWALNKSHALHRSYPLEPIGPICCTGDGFYLVGGAPSGNMYIWEVSSGRLLKNWRAHHKSLSCLVFSDDDSLLISGADDGSLHVWSMICVLDTEDSQLCGSVPSFRSWTEHGSSITGLLLTSGGSISVLISSSLDGSCKVWDVVLGCLLQTYSFSSSITAIVFDPGDQRLFAGRADGKIFGNALDIGLPENPTVVSEDQSMVLSGHNGSITSLSFSASGLWLISASEDCTACIWDASSWQITRRFNHKKGKITNLVVIPQSSLFLTEGQRSSPRFCVSFLDKTPRITNSYEGTVALLPACCSLGDDFIAPGFQSSDSLNQQILDLEQGRTPEAIQMKVETSVENRLWVMRMTKHVTDMNKHMRSRLLDLVQRRLYPESEPAPAKRKKSGASVEEKQPGSPA